MAKEKQLSVFNNFAINIPIDIYLYVSVYNNNYIKRELTGKTIDNFISISVFSIAIFRAESKNTFILRSIINTNISSFYS